MDTDLVFITGQLVRTNWTDSWISSIYVQDKLHVVPGEGMLEVERMDTDLVFITGQLVRTNWTDSWISSMYRTNSMLSLGRECWR